MRERLPDTRRSVTHKVTIGGKTEVYFIIGLYPDGRPGELFIRVGQDGSTIGGLAEQWAIAISMLLQTGTTMKEIARKFGHTRFEPAGFTDSDEIREAKSITDYVVRWMERRFDDERVQGNDSEEVPTEREEETNRA
jgi:ribonucleoside-diphosphate reductase alpha chain